MMRSIALLLAIVASSGTAEAARQTALRFDQLAESQESGKQVSNLVARGIPQENTNKIHTAGVSLVTSLVTAFEGDEPDLDYAIEVLNLQGWQLVSLLSEDPRSDSMRRAKNAWKQVFGDLPDLVQDMQDASASGDAYAVLGVVQSTIDTALRTCAEGFPADKAEIFLATADLVDGYFSSCIQFAKVIQSQNNGGSLVQVGSNVTSGVDSKWINSLLTTSVGIVTSLISAFSEEPVDVEYALDSVHIQGWKLITLFVPEEDRKSEGMRKTKVAWDGSFSLVGDIHQHVQQVEKDGTKAIIETLVSSVVSALDTCAGIWTTEAVYFNAIGDLLVGLKISTMKFSQTIGLL
jgi:hypothetical protein